MAAEDFTISYMFVVYKSEMDHEGERKWVKCETTRRSHLLILEI